MRSYRCSGVSGTTAQLHGVPWVFVVFDSDYDHATEPRKTGLLAIAPFSVEFVCRRAFGNRRFSGS